MYFSGSLSAASFANASFVLTLPERYSAFSQIPENGLSTTALDGSSNRYPFSISSVHIISDISARLLSGYLFISSEAIYCISGLPLRSRDTSSASSALSTSVMMISAFTVLSLNIAAFSTVFFVCVSPLLSVYSVSFTSSSECSS